ncbi:MAG: hypothetical protein ACI8RD_006645 [Bacillariaceae sp.]|jgi:hypothetical protein
MYLIYSSLLTQNYNSLHPEASGGTNCYRDIDIVSYNTTYVTVLTMTTFEESRSKLYYLGLLHLWFLSHSPHITFLLTTRIAIALSYSNLPERFGTIFHNRRTIRTRYFTRLVTIVTCDVWLR